MTTYRQPSVSETAFNCPHCGALAQQEWKALSVRNLFRNPLPKIWKPSDDVNIAGAEDIELIQLVAERGATEKLSHGRPVVIPSKISSDGSLVNAHLSVCFNCKNVAIWISDRLVYPALLTVPPPNADIPEEIRNDYKEAAEVLNVSPRSSAALLRLVIQKICKHLGKNGKNLNDDIGALVEDGLGNHIQKALDTVRVIGNNAVHPGEINLNDNRETAVILFRLINLIADRLLTEPKQVEEVYSMLPAGALEAINRRDGKA